MSFLAPAALWFALTLPVVVLFYLLKRKRVVRLISSTVLWQRFLAETQASSPFQRLRHSWLLILQLLLLLLAVLALSRPYFSGEITGGRLFVLILDASASMQSTDESPSRFEKARADALDLVGSLHDDDQMVLLAAGGGAQVLQSATSEKAALRRALQNARVADSSTRLGEALKMAESLTRDNPNAEVHLFSDGAAVGLEDLENRALNLVYHRAGLRSRNVGIVHLDLRPNPEDPAQRAVFVGLANAGTETLRTDVELHFNGQLVETKPVTIGPTNVAPVVFLAAQRADGVFEVRIPGNDDLPVDDRAFLISQLPQPLRVLLVSAAGNRFLEKALRSTMSVQLSTAGSLSNPQPPFDVVVLDGVAPPVWPTVNLLALQSAESSWFETMGTVDSPMIVDWKNAHPLMRFVSLDNVMISRARAVSAPDWGERVVDSAQTPLIVAGERGQQRIVWVGFDLLESTWPLRVSFPIFIANAMDWLNPEMIRASQRQVAAGTPFRLSLDQPVSQAELVRPDGVREALVLDPKAPELVVGNTDRQGIYHVQWSTNRVEFAVNLLNQAETMTQPMESLDMGRFGSVEAVTIRRASVEVWRWIALGALAVLLFEWWFYHRRTA